MTYNFVRFKEKIIRPGRRIIFLCLLIIPTGVYSQNYFFDNYGVAEGIAQSTVFDIIQDQYDHVWMGTRAGVSRFNGQEFVNYTMEDGLAENAVRIIYRDSSGRIWFGHDGGGVSWYDGNQFHVFMSAGQQFKTNVTGIVSDNNGNLWISAQGDGVLKITNTGKDFVHSEFELFIGNDLSDRVFGIYKDSKGRLFFNTDAFIKIYNPETNSFSGFSPDGMPNFFNIVTMFEDSRNNLWFGTFHGGLYKYETEKDSFRVYDIRDGLSSNWISALSEDHLGNIWVGTWGGGITLIPESGPLFVFNTENGLPDMEIRKLHEDKEGNILVGTNENGLSIFKGENFVSWYESDGLIDPQVYAVLQDSEGTFWMGTNNGISLYDSKSNQFSDFHKLKGKQIRFIREDSKRRIWIAAENEGVFTYNLNNGNFSYEPKLNSYIEFLIATALEPGSDGSIWAGTVNGLVAYDYDSRTAAYYTQISGLTSNSITSLYNDDNGQLWIGMKNSGLDYFKGDSIYSLNLEEEFSATCITSDNHGMLWVGTEARGVMVIDPEKEEVLKNLKVSDGLLANLINLIEVDEHNIVYIGTNKGLNIYNPELDRTFSFNQKNGFTGIETRPSSVFYDKDGYLWFGTVAGITRYNPDVSRKVNIDPLTHIVKIKVNLEDRKLNQDLILKHNENDVVFDYISICLTNPDAVAYQIMLEGADNDWRPSTRQTSVTYPSLAPGKYTFRLKGRNSDGVWNEEAVSYHFQIKPPFYQTAWFIIIMIVVLTAGIITYIKIREKNLIREKKILEEKVKERTAEVVAQKEELAEKNKDITDSIRYAKRIQVAIMPPEIPFDDTFILFKPKDIVSGDFYWLEVVGDKEFIAAVDCTGHGVPGAFMSIIGSNFLNKIVKEKGIYKPGEILDALNVEVVESLKTTDEESTVYDGMDLALVCYDRKSGVLEFAGGYNPLLMIRDGELSEIKADRFGIGRSSRIEENKNFTNHVVEVKKGDTMFIFSDGYADQFGGETGKKFKSKPMKELFLAIIEKSAAEQREILDKTFEAWRGDIGQVDDVLVIGRKF